MKKGLLIVIPLVLIIGYVLSPYYSARQLVDAAQREDVAKLERYIDFPQLRSNIKARVKGEVEESLGGSVPPEFGELLRAGSDLIVGPLVDRFVSPEGISDIIQGRKDWRELGRELKGRGRDLNDRSASAPPQAPLEDSEREQAGKHERRWQLDGWRFTGINTVVVDCRQYKDGIAGDSVRLFLERQGLRWRLVDVALRAQTEEE